MKLIKHFLEKFKYLPVQRWLPFSGEGDRKSSKYRAVSHHKAKEQSITIKSCILEHKAGVTGKDICLDSSY